MTDTTNTDPDAPVISTPQGTPFPLPDDKPKPPSPFATQSDIDKIKKMVKAASADPTQKFAEMPPPVKPAVTADLIVKLLLDLPDDIFDMQAVYDSVLIQYEARLSDLTFKSYSVAMFPPKKEGEPIRVASNEYEHKDAVSQLLVADEKMKLLTNELNEAKNELALVKNKFLSAQIAATLLVSK